MAKKYSINVEKDQVVSVEVDGVQYSTPDQVPDARDRARILALMPASLDLETSIPTDKPTDISKILFFVFLSIAVLMLAIAVFSAVLAGRSLSGEAEAQGYVVELVARLDSAGAEFYYPVVEYYLPDGSRHTVELTVGSRPPAYQLGELVTVAYNPERLDSARIKSFSSASDRWIVTIITGILGIAFLAAAFFARWISKQVPAEAMDENLEPEDSLHDVEG